MTEFMSADEWMNAARDLGGVREAFVEGLSHANLDPQDPDSEILRTLVKISYNATKYGGF